MGPWSGEDGSPSPSGDSGEDSLVLTVSTPLFIPDLPFFWQKHPGEDLVQPHAQHGEWHRKCYFDHNSPHPEDEKALVTTSRLWICLYYQMAWKRLKLGTVTNASLVMFHFFCLTVLSIIFLTVR